MAVLLVIVLYVTGIVFTILIGQNKDSDIRYEGRWSRYDYWGTVPKSMFTLFQVTTGDSWGSSVARPLVFYIQFFIFPVF